MRPRVLFVSRRVELPLSEGERRRWDAVRAEMDFRAVAAGPTDGDEFRLAAEPRALAGPAYYAALPVRIARQLRSFRPHAVVAQGAHETAAALAARRLAHAETAVIADVHGDWHAPTRLYGSRLRELLNPLADRVAERALRRADGVRTVTAYTSNLVRELGIEPSDEFPAYMDFTTFLCAEAVPLPERPRALFVGVLERYKNIDGLVGAWRKVATSVPTSSLEIVGDGRLRGAVEQLVADLPAHASWTPRLSPAEVAAALDRSTCLVLPSRSEGMGRVVVEAFCRGRAVVASRVGGIPDLVEDRVNGLLVEPGDVEALANSLAMLLADRDLADRLGRAARASATRWSTSAEEFAGRLRALVERVAGLS